MMVLKTLILVLVSLLLFRQIASQENDLVQDTCKKISSTDTQINYSFCVRSFKSVPESKSADLAGLGLISTQLAVTRANGVLSRVRKLLKKQGIDDYDKKRLEDCSDLYLEATSHLETALEDVKVKNYADVNVYVSAAMAHSATCEDGFKEEEGRVSPLTKENDSFSKTSAICLAITNLL